MTLRKTFEVFLYKNKLNEKSLFDVMGNLSDNTMTQILNDLKLEQKNVIYAFSDGGAKNNGKPNAKAGYSIYFPEFAQFNKTRLVTTDPTNNKAELSGIKAILKTVCDNQNVFNNSEVIILTDSQYSINCIKWANNWQKNNWVTSKKEPVKNKELIQGILSLIDSMPVKVTFKHVFSHTKEPKDKNSMEWFFWNGNNIVDTNINKLFHLIEKKNEF